MAPSSTRSAKADRTARRAATRVDKVPSPPKHENNVLLQGLVKLVGEEKVRKGIANGVTADIVKTLQTHRSNGVDPCLLLDGHGSRFDWPFVDYIHGELKWTVMIGAGYLMERACGK
jgi:hypothetical protein